MFVLHSSNRTENLVWHLKTVLESQPLSDPMQREWFLIQSQGMERWLSQQLARHFKVWGHFGYSFPAKFFNQISEWLALSGAGDAFDRHCLVWRIERLLRDLNSPVFEPLRRYLSGERQDLKRYQLAGQLARLFDQYQLLRPDWLAQWQQADGAKDLANEAWQAALWRVLADCEQPHRGEQWLNVIDLLNHHTSGHFSDCLPQRVSVFGINSLPPLLLSYLQALSRHMDVHFYLLNPVQGYWADLPSKALASRLAEFDGHPLLVRLGQQGREFQQLLLEQVQFEFEPSSFEASAAQNNLQRLQNDVLANRVEPQIATRDDSISVHACHSRLREVQVLKDQLLATLDKEPDLQLRDIVVMAPDIQQYAPYIHAVFDDIAHAVADRSLRSTQWALEGLVAFMRLTQSRMGWQSVLELLEHDLVARRFGLSRDDLAWIRQWLADLNTRWGRDARHKQQLGLPPLDANTWQAALQRLFVGYAVAEEEEFVGDVLPYAAIEGGSAQALGGLNDFLQTLFRCAETWSQPTTLAQWQQRLSQCVEQLFDAQKISELLPLYELLAELSKLSEWHAEAVDWSVILAWLEGQMDEHVSANGFLRGQLTFCSLLPMRSIPFDVIALLGMNEGEFPKQDRAPVFDLIRQQPRLGDRSSRADDRYQFLEVLLSARRQLIVTFTGQSLRDNSRLPPSVVVSELLDVLQEVYQLHDLITYHPLHAFSPRYFDGQAAALFSYQAQDCRTAQQLVQAPESPGEWWHGQLACDEQASLEIARWMQFFRHPQRFFLQQILGVELPGIGQQPEEREPFALDSRVHYQVMQEWLADYLQHREPSVERLQAEGYWPQAALGQLVWQTCRPVIVDFAERIADLALGEPLPAQLIELDCHGQRVVGKLANCYQNGSLYYRLAKLKSADFMQAWLHHLLINRVDPQNTYLLSTSQSFCFTPQHIAADDLEFWLGLYRQGCKTPTAFLSDAALYYVQQAPDRALQATIKYWLEQLQGGYQPESARLFGHTPPEMLFDQAFETLCRERLQPAWSQALMDSEQERMHD